MEGSRAGKRRRDPAEAMEAGSSALGAPSNSLWACHQQEQQSEAQQAAPGADGVGQTGGPGAGAAAAGGGSWICRRAAIAGARGGAGARARCLLLPLIPRSPLSLPLSALLCSPLLCSALLRRATSRSSPRACAASSRCRTRCWASSSARPAPTSVSGAARRGEARQADRRGRGREWGKGVVSGRWAGRGRELPLPPPASDEAADDEISTTTIIYPF
jgi:hypothetical protein